MVDLIFPPLLVVSVVRLARVSFLFVLENCMRNQMLTRVSILFLLSQLKHKSVNLSDVVTIGLQEYMSVGKDFTLLWEVN